MTRPRGFSMPPRTGTSRQLSGWAGLRVGGTGSVRYDPGAGRPVILELSEREIGQGSSRRGEVLSTGVAQLAGAGRGRGATFNSGSADRVVHPGPGEAVSSVSSRGEIKWDASTSPVPVGGARRRPRALQMTGAACFAFLGFIAQPSGPPAAELGRFAKIIPPQYGHEESRSPEWSRVVTNGAVWYARGRHELGGNIG